MHRPLSTVFWQSWFKQLWEAYIPVAQVNAYIRNMFVQDYLSDPDFGQGGGIQL